VYILKNHFTWLAGEGMKFAHMILRKIIKIVATRCQILRLKCTKIDFGWSSAPDPAGELTALPTSPSWDKGDLLLREEERCRDWKGEGGREGREREWTSGGMYL